MTTRYFLILRTLKKNQENLSYISAKNKTIKDCNSSLEEVNMILKTEECISQMKTMPSEHYFFYGRLYGQKNKKRYGL